MCVRTSVILILTGALFVVANTAGAQIVFRRPSDRGIVVQRTPQPQSTPVVSKRTGGAVVRPEGSNQDPISQTRPVDNDLLQSRAAERDRQAQRRRTGDAMVESKAPRVPDGQRPTQGPPYIFASPSTVIAKPGETFGYAVILWDGGPSHPYAEIWRSVDGGAAEFLLEKGKGETGARIDVGRTHTFILTDSGETLGTVTVNGVRDPKNSPIERFERPGRDVEANMTTFITDVGSEARSKTVEIKFFAAANANPIVEIGTARPIQSNGRWVFPQGKLVGSGSATPSGIKKVGTKANTFHRFTSEMPGFPELQQSTVYWYIVTTQNPDFQTTDQFSTSATAIGVRVVFEKIKIIDDSDELSAGDISVWMWVNAGQPGGEGKKNGRRSMSTDEVYDLGNEFVLKNAPSTLTISVSAEDDDCSVGCRFGFEGTPLPIRGWYNNKDEADGNGAELQWDLTRFPTFKNEVYRHAFKLRSRGGDAKLQFEVTGYWEITRQN